MRVFPFDIPEEEDVIVVNASIEGKFKFQLALDTAATHTTIDSNVLYFSGYELKAGKGGISEFKRKERKENYAKSAKKCKRVWTTTLCDLM